jgi:hypothetical protein
MSSDLIGASSKFRAVKSFCCLRHRFQVWRAALEARYRAPARTTIVEPDGQRPNSPRRLHSHNLRGGVGRSYVWPRTGSLTSVGNGKPRGIEAA